MEQNMTKADVIYYTTKYDILEEVVRKTDEIKNNDLLMSEFIIRLGVYITNKSGMVLVSFGEDKKMSGCVVLSRHIDKQGEYIWLDFCWCDKRYPQLMKKFADEISNTAILYGIKRVQARTNRSIKALNRKYGFYEVAKIIERKI